MFKVCDLANGTEPAFLSKTPQCCGLWSRRLLSSSSQSRASAHQNVVLDVGQGQENGGGRTGGRVNPRTSSTDFHGARVMHQFLKCRRTYPHDPNGTVKIDPFNPNQLDVCENRALVWYDSMT